MKAQMDRINQATKLVEEASQNARKKAGKLVNAIIKSNGQIKKALMKKTQEAQ